MMEWTKFNFMAAWWNAIHTTLKMSRPKGIGGWNPPAATKSTLIFLPSPCGGLSMTVTT
jgi:hypothetical protein